MFDVQKTASGVGRCGQRRSHVASPAARCGLYTGTRHGRGSDRADHRVRVGDQPKERTVMSSRRWSPRIGKHEAATGRRSPVNQNGVAVIPTTNTSSSAIRSWHQALTNSRRRSTRGRG